METSENSIGNLCEFNDLEAICNYWSRVMDKLIILVKFLCLVASLVIVYQDGFVIQPQQQSKANDKNQKHMKPFNKKVGQRNVTKI